MKSSLLTRTLLLSGLALTPVTWLLAGCGGGGGGGSSSGSTDPTATPVATATATAGGTPAPTAISTPIPTPTVPSGGQRILSNISLGRGQTGVLNLVISRFGALNGLIIVPPIPAESVGTFAIEPGTYRISGQYSLPNNFRLTGALQTVTGASIPLSIAGTTALGGNPGTITVTAGGTTFPTQNF